MKRKPQVGVGKRDEDFPVKSKQKAVAAVAEKNAAKKVRVFIPELKCSVLLDPGTDVKKVVERYMAAKAFNGKAIRD